MLDYEDNVKGADSSKREIPKGAKERLYDKIPFSKKQMDIIVVILIITTVIVFVIGALIGNGII